MDNFKTNNNHVLTLTLKLNNEQGGSLLRWCMCELEQLEQLISQDKDIVR